ncbi:hypothetical protein [Dyella sp. ASV21]|uniref:hypothetical protein n=1 Tax=Dyella sp. ASV21 TaxID=2795114 RepID=UPI0018EB239D|nr:hypothetical protein [Dyella sp. ASV21]
MELDDFKTAWQQLDRQLQRQYALEMHRFEASGVERAQRRLRPLRWGQVLQILVGVVLIVLSAGFWSAHRSNLHLLLSGVALHVYGVLIVLASARNLYLIGRVDYGQPVVVIQKRLAQLRAWRVGVEAPVFGALGCFIWIPLVLVLFDAWWNVDLWAHAPGVVWGFVASGVGCLLVLLGIVAWSRRPGRERFAAALGREAAGGSIARAQAALEDVLAFERA